MKRRKWEKGSIKGFVAGVLVTAILSTTIVFASASGVMREIVFGINVVVNGVQAQFTEANRPFTMGGTTFLPLRAVSELLDMPVDFDPSTNTAFVGGRYAAGTRRPLNQAAPFFDSGHLDAPEGQWSHTARLPQVSDSATLGGRVYSGVILYSSSTNRGVWVTQHGTFTLHNLNGQYRLLTGYIGRVDGSVHIDSTVRFYGDGVLLRTHSLNATDMPTPISVFVEGVRQLRIEVEFPQPGPMGQLGQSTEIAIYALQGFLE